MIALRHDKEYFDLYDNTSLTLEAESPVFATDRIPGLKVYKFSLPNSRINRLLMQHAGEISRRSAFRILDNVNLELYYTHFKRGKLILEGADQESMEVSFISDTGDVAATLKELSLRDLDLGTESVYTTPVDTVYPSRNHCFFTVKNPLFYGDANPDYGGYMNMFQNNAFQINTGTNEHTLVPFVFVPFVLDKIAETIGYRLSGAFLNEINNLAIYSNVSLDQLDGSGVNVYKSTFNYADHLPDISCAQFLQAIRNLFGLAKIFNTTSQVIEIHKLTDLITQTNYLNLDHAAVPTQKVNPYDLDGFRISMGMDSSDELYKRKSTKSFYKEQGAGELKIESAAGTLFMASDEDPRNPGQDWTIPQVEQPGTSSAFELENEATLRLLWFHGLQGGTMVASPYGDQYDLSYLPQDDNNLYDKVYQKWLQHVEYPSVQTDLALNLTDLLSLSFTRKILLKNTAYLLEKYSVPVTKRGLGKAGVVLRKVKY